MDKTQKKITQAVNEIADIVKSTLGARGRNVMIVPDFEQPLITKDGVTVAKHVQSDDKIKNGIMSHLVEVALKTNEAAGDGPQPINTPIATPNGFVEMKDLKVGDVICGTNGTYQTVLGVFNKGLKDLYTVKMFDGREIKCSGDHLWTVTDATSKPKKKTLTTKEMFEKGVTKRTPDGYIFHRFYIQLTEVEFEYKPVSIDPYLLGVLLGDGSLSGKNAHIELSLGENKKHILDKIKLPEGVAIRVNWVDKKNYYRIKFYGNIKELLEKYGLLGAKSMTKFIPRDYIFNSIEVRKNLLQGLLDTDGYINDRGLFQYSTISETLKNDFITLVNSLGIPVTSKLHKRKENDGSYSNRDIYRISQRKGFKYGEPIQEIIYSGRKEEMACIKVSNKDKLYITSGFIPTHNTTTSVVLSQALYNEGIKAIDEGHNIYGVIKGMNIAKDLVFKYLDTIKIATNDKNTLFNVAKISANGDEKVAQVVVDAFESVGFFEGVNLELSRTGDTYYEKTDGYVVKDGLVHGIFADNILERKATLTNVDIVLYDGKIEGSYQFKQQNGQVPFLDSYIGSDRSVLFVANDFSEEFLEMVAKAKKQAGFKANVLRVSEVGRDFIGVLNDLQAKFGGKVLSDKENGLKELLPDTDLVGHADKVVISEKQTVFYGDTKVPKEYIDGLKKQLEEADTEYKKDKLKFRISSLQYGIATIYYGGLSDVEQAELKFRVEDAVNAVKSALKDGVVAGGGAALYNFEFDKTDLPDVDIDIKRGMQVVFNAIKAPLKTILENGNIEIHKKLDELEKVKEKHKEVRYFYGIDVLSGEISNMVSKNILDPTYVEKVALQNAISVVSTLLTTGRIVDYKKRV